MGFARFFGYLTALYYLWKTEMALLPTFCGFVKCGFRMRYTVRLRTNVWKNDYTFTNPLHPAFHKTAVGCCHTVQRVFLSAKGCLKVTVGWRVNLCGGLHSLCAFCAFALCGAKAQSVCKCVADRRAELSVCWLFVRCRQRDNTNRQSKNTTRQR